MDKDVIVEKYQSKKVMKSLVRVEKRLEELETLRENLLKEDDI